MQAGDTLQSIAQTAYGDSKLWYLIADANGLSGDRDMRVGQAINIPNRVAGNRNDYKTFKPYDAGKIIGDTTPTMPVPEPEDSGGGGGCGGIGTIIVAVVAVVATVFTMGALAPVTAALATSIGTVAAGVATAAVAAAVGSVVSQGVGMALGVQDKFSWSAVGTSALAAGVTYGVGEGLGAAAESSNSTPK